MGYFKRSLVFSTLLVLLLGCEYSNSPIDTPIITNTPVTTSITIVDNFYVADMTGYINLSEYDNSTFIGVNPDYFIKMVAEKENGIYLLASTSCTYCQEAVPLIYKAAKEVNRNVYYLDCHSDQYPINSEITQILYKELYDYLERDSSGEKALMTPHLFVINTNGGISGSLVGLGNSFDGSESSLEELLNTYLDLMEE